MIVKNESSCIEKCLDSVKGADEIVIIDTGSTDNTIELCKKYTKKVYSDKWDDNFSRSRNVSLRKCTTDFIIIIDADEVLVTSIDRIKKTINDFWFRSYEGMTFTVNTNAETLESPRVFKNCKEIYYINPVHNLPSWNGSVNYLMAKMYKSAFVIDSGYSEAHNLDPDRTLRILLKELGNNPDDSRSMYYVAKEYMNRKDIDNAMKWFLKFRELRYHDVDLWDGMLAHGLYLLALLCIDDVTYGRTKWFEAMQYAQESWGVLPTSSDTAMLLKELYKMLPSKREKPGMGLKSMASDFWEIIEKNCSNKDVMTRMNFQ